MRRFSLCLSMLLLVSIGFGCKERKPVWKVMSSEFSNDDPGDTFFDVCFVDQNHGWGITSVYVLESLDAGRSWKQRADVMDLGNLESMDFLDGSRGWVGGSALSPAGAAGPSRGLVMRTVDGGRTWNKHSTPTIPGIHRLRFCSPDTGWATYEDGVYRSTDGGQTWESRFKSPKNVQLQGLDCNGCESVLAVGSEGTIVRTTNGGDDWISLKPLVTSTLLGVKWVDSTAWAVGTQGTLLVSEDSGLHWVQKRTGVSGALVDISAIDNECWAVGQAGIVIRSSDRGRTWKPFTSPTRSDLYSLFLSARAGWAAGGNSTILRLESEY